MFRVGRVAKRFSVNKGEMDMFDKIQGWWDPTGPMHILYEYNYIRVEMLVAEVKKTYGEGPVRSKPLKGYRVLDAGCGAGILSQSLARLGADVTAIDPNENSIQQARNHKQDDPSLSTLKYRQTTIQQLLKTHKEEFDIVTSMQVIEHVQNPKEFVRNLGGLARDKGLVMMSTIKRSWASYFTHIILAEHLARIVPVGTHHHHKFINMDQLESFMEQANCYPISRRSVAVMPSGKFKDTSYGDNYMIVAQKRN